jgi:hypothetical protein
MPEDVYGKILNKYQVEGFGISGPEQCEIDWVFRRNNI